MSSRGSGRERTSSSSTPPLKSCPPRIEWAVKVFRAKPTDNVLEIGCGNGCAAGLIAQSFSTGSLLAIDRSANAIQKTKSLIKKLRLGRKLTALRADLKDLSGKEGPFDRAFAFNVNVFWSKRKNDAIIFKTIQRILKPKGRLFVFYQLPSRSVDVLFLKNLADHFESHGFKVMKEHVHHDLGAMGLELLATPSAQAGRYS